MYLCLDDGASEEIFGVGMKYRLGDFSLDKVSLDGTYLTDRSGDNSQYEFSVRVAF